MPNITLNCIPTTDLVPNYFGAQTTDGHLLSLLAVITHGTAETGQVHIQAGTYVSVVDEFNLLSVLIDDYVYTGHTPAWTGKVPIEGSEGIYAIIRSDAAVTVRIAGKTLKFDP